MPTPGELIRAILAPVLVAALIAALARWRKWAWAIPAAAGAGFLVGYALLGIPSLPPRDGNDWLFWLILPLTALGIVDALIGGRWSWIFGAAAGAVAFAILRPLSPGGISPGQIWQISLALAVGGAAIVLAASVAERAIGGGAVIAAFCIVLGGSAVVVLSSNIRVVGMDGISASAALGPIIFLLGRVKAARSVAIVSAPILAGLLVSGHFYADDGISWMNFILLMACPLLLLLGLVVPKNRNWLRAGVAVLAVAIAVAAISGPIALAAKKAAEGDAADYYK